MEDKEASGTNENKVILQFGNYVEWNMYIVNCAKGKNKDLENLIRTELEPRFEDPDQEATFGGRRIYSEDKFGYLKYEADWKENRDRKKKICSSITMVSINNVWHYFYSSTG